MTFKWEIRKRERRWLLRYYWMIDIGGIESVSGHALTHRRAVRAISRNIAHLAPNTGGVLVEKGQIAL